MRHRKKINHLSRKSAHRKAMLANMATSLILHKRIHTTTAKAKALRVYVEPLINRSKEDTTHSRRVVFSYLQSKEAITELFRVISVKVADRPGGYTRIIKLDNRLGDNAEMCMMELVDFNENLLSDKGAKTTKSTRRKRGGKKKAADTETKEAAVEVQTETMVEEKPEQESEVQDEVIEEVAAKEEAKVEEKVEVEAKKEVKEEVATKEEPKAEVKEKVEEKVAKPEAKKEDTAPETEKKDKKAENPDSEEKK